MQIGVGAMSKIIKIDIDTYEGFIEGDLVVYEKGEDPLTKGIVLHGFDEVDIFSDRFKNPQYCMVSDNA